MLFADEAAAVLGGARRVGQLGSALQTRDLIGRAKGILVERFAIDDDAAFQVLVESSQSLDRTIVDVAARLVATRTGEHAAGFPRSW